MTKLNNKMPVLASVLGATVLLAGCVGGCPENRVHKKPKVQQYVQPVEVVESDTYVVYQAYPQVQDDVKHVTAKMYTHSSRGGESKMGHIKFKEEDGGLKMIVDLKDMRSGVPYNVRIYQCSSCYNDARCCDKSKMMNIQLPTLETGMSGKLEETYMIQGIDAGQLNGANIYLERDGGYKAGWGKLEK